jgi:hypothetical protein
VTTRQTFRILLVKPSKYAPNGDVERFAKDSCQTPRSSISGV